MMHPIFRQRKYILNYCAVWFAIGAIQTSILNYFYGFRLDIAFADSFVFYSLFGILSIGLWYSVRQNDFATNRVTDIVLNHLGIATITLTAWYFTGYYVLNNLIKNNDQYLTFLDNSLPWRLTSGLFYYLLTILFYYLIVSFENIQEKTEKEAQLNTLVKETELNMLKAQINPHFLFNSLNSISSLTITNPAKAQEMIIKLSEFLRHSIGHKERDMVPFKEEIAQIMLYLDIEKVRFGERLQYQIDIDKECMDFPVPNLLLQPLFENAIKHGVYESTEKVTIKFTGKTDVKGVIISIANNFDPTSSPRKGNGLGIKNVTNRLKLIYQYDDLLTIHRTENTFEATLLLPYNNLNNND
jgi:Putative regulator of cell autolysis